MTTAETDGAGRSGPSGPARRTGLFRRNVWVLLVAMLMIAAGVGTVLPHSNNARELRAQEEQIAELEQRLSTAKALKAEAEAANTYEALGITESRLVSDRAVIEDLLSTAFTWQDATSYQRARGRLIDQFDLAEDGVFLTEFMPPAAFTGTGEDKRYYIDQAGLVFSLGDDVVIDVVRVTGTDYEYVVLADVDVTSSQVTPASDGSTPTSTRRMLLKVTVDGEGGVSDLSGVPPSGTTRSSG